MGGLVAADFVAGGIGSAAAWSRPVDALVLSSPALDPGMKGGQKLLLALLGTLAPSLAVGNGLNPEWVSRDTQVVRNYRADPLVHDRVTPRLVNFIVDGGRRVSEHAGEWNVPTLLLYAGSDRCVAPAGSAGFAAAAPQALVAVHEFRALYHEIFNEPEQADVFGVLHDWLDTLDFTAKESER
jgi:alpha-beta hydrolase superfamily lysophospholipase